MIPPRRPTSCGGTPQNAPPRLPDRLLKCPSVVGAPGGLPAEALGGPPSRCALRWTAFAWTESEGWAHFELPA